MKGILYKTIVGRKDPAGTVTGVRSALESWWRRRVLTPAHLWPGASVTQGFLSKIEPAWCAKNLKAGVVGLWMPNNTSAHTLSIVGGKPSAWTKALIRKRIPSRCPGPTRSSTPYLLDDKGRCYRRSKKSFAWLTNKMPRSFLASDQARVQSHGGVQPEDRFKRGVVDHPFSPFVSLTIEEMKSS